MCGIAGFIDTQLSADAKRDLTHRMLCQITHRGPEASNVFIDGPVALGHNRLKIIDLSDAANQPLQLRIQSGYDHSYWFIQTFIEDHLRHHAAVLCR